MTDKVRRSSSTLTVRMPPCQSWSVLRKHVRHWPRVLSDVSPGEYFRIKRFGTSFVRLSPHHARRHWLTPIRNMNEAEIGRSLLIEDQVNAIRLQDMSVVWINWYSEVFVIDRNDAW